MPSPAHRSGVFVLSAVLLLSLLGCSPQAPDAAPSGSKSTVIIVRESKPEFPDKAIARYRELQQRCIEGRIEVAKAQGWAYDPATDAIADADILALDTEKSEEYFDGQKYAVIVTGTQVDGTSFGPTQESNCKLKSMPFKSVDIRDGDCRRMSVEYDLPQSSGRRTEIKGACDKASQDTIDQSGEVVTVAGKQQCRWNKGDGNPLHVPTCTLLPNRLHAGTGLPLIAIRKNLGSLRSADQPLAGTEALTYQSLVMVEQATSIEVGGSIPAAKFEAPADSTNFPLTQL